MPKFIGSVDSHDDESSLHSRFNAVKATFIMRGTSFHAWCAANDIAPQNARAALLGKWKGPKGRATASLILRETNLENTA